MGKRWNTTEINRLIAGGENRDMISTVAKTIGRSEDAIIIRAYELGIGYETFEGNRVLKSGINHYAMNGDFAGKTMIGVTPVQDIINGVVENLEKINDEDRYMYDLITGLTKAAMVMIDSKNPTPFLEKLLDTEPTATGQEVIIVDNEKKVLPLVDMTQNNIVELVFARGEANMLTEVKKALKGKAKFSYNGNDFHLKRTEHKTVTGYTYSLKNTTTGTTLAEQRTEIDDLGNQITIYANRIA